MSNAQTRQDIADALSEVPGINGYPSRPNVMAEGDAWPQWRGSEYAGGHAYINNWVVLVVLPKGDVSADAFADSHGEQLVDALRPVMSVQSTTPAEIASEGGQIYALMLSGRSE
jgi:hypothetical protein